MNDPFDFPLENLNFRLKLKPFNQTMSRNDPVITQIFLL